MDSDCPICHRFAYGVRLSPARDIELRHELLPVNHYHYHRLETSTRLRPAERSHQSCDLWSLNWTNFYCVLFNDRTERRVWMQIRFISVPSEIRDTNVLYRRWRAPEGGIVQLRSRSIPFLPNKNNNIYLSSSFGNSKMSKSTDIY